MNRLNIKSIFAAVAIASVTFTSCDGYLETFPSDSLVSTDAITTLQDVETALNGTYYSLKSANYYGCEEPTLIIVSYTVRITRRKIYGAIRMPLSTVRMYC